MIIAPPTQAEVNAHNALIQMQIDSLQRRLSAVQRKYDSLHDFKNAEHEHEDTFMGVSADKHSKLTSIDGYKEDCNVCKIYLEGMNNSFWKVANEKFVDSLFTPLKTHINSKLEEYYDEIERLRREIDRLRSCLW